MRIHHVAITVNDIEESSEFYKNVFGFQLSKSFGRPDLGAKAIQLELDNFHLELWQFTEMKTNQDNLEDLAIRGIRHIAFSVDELDTIIPKLKKQGVQLTKPKLGASGHWYSFTTDPNGIAIEFYQN